MEKGGYIYIITNKNRTVLYIGVTNNLKQRIWEHRTHHFKNSFVAKYNLEVCIYYESFHRIDDAIDRVSVLKKWSRKKKEDLINQLNPKWIDLWEEIEAWV